MYLGTKTHASSISLTGESSRRERRRAHANASRGEGALIPGDGVLVCRYVHQLEHKLYSSTVHPLLDNTTVPASKDDERILSLRKIHGRRTPFRLHSQTAPHRPLYHCTHGRRRCRLHGSAAAIFPAHPSFDMQRSEHSTRITHATNSFMPSQSSSSLQRP